VCANKPFALDDLNYEYYYSGGDRVWERCTSQGGLTVNKSYDFFPHDLNLKIQDAAFLSFPDSILLIEVSKRLVVGSGLRTKVRYRSS